VLPDIERKLIVATRSLQQFFVAFLHLFWYAVCGLLVLVMVYGLRLGRSRIFATPAAHPRCACFVAGEPGGGSVSRRGVGGCAAGGCVGVQTERGQARGVCVQAAGGCGYTTSWDVHAESSAPVLFQSPLKISHCWQYCNCRYCSEPMYSLVLP